MRGRTRLRAAAAALALVVSTRSAVACSCAASTAAEMRRKARAVFAGRVVSMDPPPETPVLDSAAPVTVWFDVLRIWKGPRHPVLKLRTARSTVSCGYEFSPGEAYLVYATGRANALVTSLCLRTQPLSGAQEDLAVLGEGWPVAAEK